LNESSALAHADELAGQAAELLTPDQRKDSFDLMILKAEIAAANRRYADSRKLLGGVIESLRSERGAPCSEILARAYAARAHVALTSRGARSEVLYDLRRARDIFTSQELSHAAAGCSWVILTVDPASATQLKIHRTELRELEDLTVDPRTRLDAIAELERQVDTRISKHAASWKINWRSLVNQVQRYE
jgi:hypothetical protein